MDLLVRVEGCDEIVSVSDSATVGQVKAAIAELFALDETGFDLLHAGELISLDPGVPLADIATPSGAALSEGALIEVVLSRLGTARRNLAALDIPPSQQEEALFTYCGRCGTPAPEGQPDPEQVVRDLITVGTSVVCTGTLFTRTPLSVLAARGCLSLVSLVVEAAGDSARSLINAADTQGWTCAFHATAHGHLEVLQELKRLGVSLRHQDVSGCTLVHVAAQHDRPEILSQLAEWGMCLTQPNAYRARPIHFAAEASAATVARLHQLIFDEGGERAAHRMLTVREGMGFTALQKAVSEGCVGVVRELLRLGADPCDRGGSVLYPVHEAASRLDIPTLDALLAGGADVNTRDTDGRTPLHWAALSMSERRDDTPLHDEALRFLVARGGRVGVKDGAGETPAEAVYHTAREGTHAAAVVAVLLSFDGDAEVEEGEEGADGAEEEEGVTSQS